MNDDHAKAAVVRLQFEKADLALAAARREANAGDFGLVLNRIYYACFYAASAALIGRGMHFVKHAGLRAAVHQYLIRSGEAPETMGRFFDQAFKARQEADYSTAPVAIMKDELVRRVETAESFVTLMRQLSPVS